MKILEGADLKSCTVTQKNATITDMFNGFDMFYHIYSLLRDQTY